MKRIVIDLDNTLTINDKNLSYKDKRPNREIIERLAEYKNDGFEIIIFTSRNMKTYNDSVGKITAHTLPVILDWLKEHNVPFDQIHVGKPWCGADGFYVDDRAIRPSEFLGKTYAEIRKIVGDDD